MAGDSRGNVSTLPQPPTARLAVPIDGVDEPLQMCVMRPAVAAACGALPVLLRPPPGWTCEARALSAQDAIAVGRATASDQAEV